MVPRTEKLISKPEFHIIFYLDTLKTQLQLHPEMNNARIGTKMINGYTKILRQSGFFRGLYSGYFVNLAFIVPEKTVKLVSNDRLRERFKDGTGHISRSRPKKLS